MHKGMRHPSLKKKGQKKQPMDETIAHLDVSNLDMDQDVAQDETARISQIGNEDANFDVPKRKKRIKKVVMKEGGSKEEFDHFLKLAAYDVEGGENELP